MTAESTLAIISHQRQHEIAFHLAYAHLMDWAQQVSTDYVEAMATAPDAHTLVVKELAAGHVQLAAGVHARLLAEYEHNSARRTPIERPATWMHQDWMGLIASGYQLQTRNVRPAKSDRNERSLELICTRSIVEGAVPMVVYSDVIERWVSNVGAGGPSRKEFETSFLASFIDAAAKHEREYHSHKEH